MNTTTTKKMKMNNNYLTILGLLCFSQVAFGQCTWSQATNYLDGNDVKAIFRNGGDMFWDGTEATYQVPSNGGQNTNSTIFAGALWMSAFDLGGNLRAAAQTYRGTGNDYWAGPLDNSTGATINCTDYDKIWKVEGAAVRDLIVDYADNGVVDHPVDSSLLAWPGRGNPFSATVNGFALVNQDLAPFADVNLDGIYNPMDGDYPIADPNYPTVIADQILWSVFNDNGGNHTETAGIPLVAEVQRTVYAFNCPGDDVVNRTIFINHKIINKGVLPLGSFRAGLWTDFDLGCLNDDFMGTVPALNTVYAYNADSMDDNPCGTNGSGGYGANPPVQAITFLNQNLFSNLYYTNPPHATAIPTNPLSFHNLLEGVWRDGTPLTEGGGGYNPGDPNAVVTKYVFPDNPNDSSGWSMNTLNIGGGDIRTISAAHFDTLHPGQAHNLLAAYSYHRDLDSNNLQNVNLMYQQVPMIQSYYNDGYANRTCNNVFTRVTNLKPDKANNPVHVYPNPASDWLTIESKTDEIEAIALYSTLGQLVLQQQDINAIQTQINIGRLPKGVYVLKVTKGGESYTQKIWIID